MKFTKPECVELLDWLEGLITKPEWLDVVYDGDGVVKLGRK